MDVRWERREGPPGIMRRLPIGAEVQPDGGTHFRVWAPRRQSVALQWVRGHEEPCEPVPLTRDPVGYFSGWVDEVRAGDHYWFLLDGGSEKVPDPASRFQPEGPLGPSQIIDPRNYTWRDAGWPGVRLAGQILYELHVGTFTREGTWQAAEREIPELAAAGISVLEIMPIAEFSGRFSWGYDGVDLYAPSHVYGTPDDVRRFVDAAHSLGVAVVLDVVYNHLGPRGNVLKEYADDYFTDRYANDWGEAINFDGPESAPVREFFLNNVGYWIDEFHMDGLRIDATQDIHDASDSHILCEMTQHARRVAGERAVVMIAECEPQVADLLRPCRDGGFGFDGAWNDDFHHSASVAMRGHNEAYYSDFWGAPQELLSACKYGYLYQGQRSQWQRKPRGTPALDIPPWAFVTYLENHDQVANSLTGVRHHRAACPGRFRALSALQLLAPGTPLLFQGQEFGSTAPFLYFAEHPSDLAMQVTEGRREFLAQFPSLRSTEAWQYMLDPSDEKTFLQCKLDFTERERNESIYRMYRDLIRLRRSEPVLRPRDERWCDGAVLGRETFLLRYFGDSGAEDRLLVVNLGMDFVLNCFAEPLLAPPAGLAWCVRWTSEVPQYGGLGVPAILSETEWKFPGGSATWLFPKGGEECQA